MSNTGKLLEDFVERIEKIMLPQGFDVTRNEHVYNDDGVQIAEFDIEIKGKIGSTEFKWLLECRDRPTDGAAPGSWIEQLVGRRDRFNFDKVIAVSTTGFSAGAEQYAKEKGIELRTVLNGEIGDLTHWFLIDDIYLFVRGGELDHVKFIIDEKETEETKAALLKVLKSKDSKYTILKSTENNQKINAGQAFLAAVHQNGYLYDGMDKDGGVKPVQLSVLYDDESYFVVETDVGDVRIKELLFKGRLTITKKKISLDSITKYENVGKGETIASTASYKFDVAGKPVNLAFHNIPNTGETHVVLQEDIKKT
jgi:hypothetical protein